MKLNGWQRIWIVLSILLLFPAVGLMVSIANPIEKRQEIMRSWAADTSRLIYNSDPEVREKLNDAAEEPGISERERLLALLRAISGVKDLYPELSNSEFIERAQADYTGEDAKIKIDFSDINEENREQLNVLWGQFLKACGMILAVWLSICVVVYAAGWTIGWIVRGFQRG